MNHDVCDNGAIFLPLVLCNWWPDREKIVRYTYVHVTKNVNNTIIVIIELRSQIYTVQSNITKNKSYAGTYLSITSRWEIQDPAMPSRECVRNL
jgi:hypothetical protein